MTTHTARLAREDTITDALRAVDDAIGQEQPTPQAMRIIDAIKRLRSDKPVKVERLERVDYLERVQKAARVAWMKEHGAHEAGPDIYLIDTTAAIDTPIGRLTCTTRRTRWIGKFGDRLVWTSEYYLDGAPITVAEIKAASLAQRPTTRRRQRKESK